MIQKSHFVGGLVAAAFVLPALAGCDKAAAPAAAAVDPAKETAAINAQIDAFNAAMKAGDVERAIAIDATDIHSYGGGGPDVASATEDLKADQGAMHDPNFSVSVKAEHTEVAKSGDLAWQYGTWNATATDSRTKKPAKSSGHWVAAWRKDDQGRWKLAAVSNANAAMVPAAK